MSSLTVKMILLNFISKYYDMMLKSECLLDTQINKIKHITKEF